MQNLLVAVVSIGVAYLLFQRWRDTGDRSAYIMGAVAGVAGPIVGVLYLSETTRSLVQSEASWGLPLVMVHLVAQFLVAVTLTFFGIRPWVTTGLFLAAAQSEIRQRFHRVETSWQYALGAGVIGLALHVFFNFLVQRGWAIGWRL